MVAVVDQAISYLDDDIVNFNGLVIVLSGIVHNAFKCIKKSLYYPYGAAQLYLLRVYTLLNISYKILG
jgi:hypothetical protein